MKRPGFTLLALFAGLLVAPAWSSEWNPLGFYVGGAVGESDIRNNDDWYGGPHSGFDQHHTGWKVFGGIRPIQFLGAEIEYVDFGRPDHFFYNDSYYDGSSLHSTAAAAFGVAYLPIPFPFLDVYGKAGAARLHTNSYYMGACAYPGQSPCSPLYSTPRTDTDFAYGAGIQAKLATVVFRVEYERISQRGGNPDLLSAGIAWVF